MRSARSPGRWGRAVSVAVCVPFSDCGSHGGTTILGVQAHGLNTKVVRAHDDDDIIDDVASETPAVSSSTSLRTSTPSEAVFLNKSMKNERKSKTSAPADRESSSFVQSHETEGGGEGGPNVAFLQPTGGAGDVTGSSSAGEQAPPESETAEKAAERPEAAQGPPDQPERTLDGAEDEWGDLTEHDDPIERQRALWNDDIRKYTHYVEAGVPFGDASMKDILGSDVGNIFFAEVTLEATLSTAHGNVYTVRHRLPEASQDDLDSDTCARDEHFWMLPEEKTELEDRKSIIQANLLQTPSGSRSSDPSTLPIHSWIALITKSPLPGDRITANFADMFHTLRDIYNKESAPGTSAPQYKYIIVPLCLQLNIPSNPVGKVIVESGKKKITSVDGHWVTLAFNLHSKRIEFFDPKGVPLKHKSIWEFGITQIVAKLINEQFRSTQFQFLEPASEALEAPEAPETSEAAEAAPEDQPHIDIVPSNMQDRLSAVGATSGSHLSVRQLVELLLGKSFSRSSIKREFPSMLRWLQDFELDVYDEHPLQLQFDGNSCPVFALWLSLTRGDAASGHLSQRQYVDSMRRQLQVRFHFFPRFFTRLETFLKKNKHAHTIDFIHGIPVRSYFSGMFFQIQLISLPYYEL